MGWGLAAHPSLQGCDSLRPPGCSPWSRDRQPLLQSCLPWLCLESLPCGPATSRGKHSFPAFLPKRPEYRFHPLLPRAPQTPVVSPFGVQNPQEPGCQVRVSGGAGAEGRVLLEEVSPISRVRLCPLAPATPAALAPLPGLGVGSQGPERLSFRAERRKSSCGDWRGSLGPGWRAAGGPEVPRRRHFWGRGRPEADASSPHPGK